MKKTLIFILAFILVSAWAFAATPDKPTLNDVQRPNIGSDVIKNPNASMNADSRRSLRYMKFGEEGDFELPVTATVLLSDDFDDGDAAGWTIINDGTTPSVAWTVVADPWTGNPINPPWDGTHNGTGFYMGSDSDAGGSGSVTDEWLNHDFTTDGVSPLLRLRFWVQVVDIDPVEVYVDTDLVAFISVPAGYYGTATISVDISEYNDGNTHTLKFHHYSEYGYCASIDDVIIYDDINDDCAYYYDLGQGVPVAYAGTTVGFTNDYGPFTADPPCWQGPFTSGLSAGGPDAVFRWTAPYTANYYFSVCDADYDAAVMLYNFTCPTEPAFPGDFICGSDNNCPGFARGLLENIACTTGQEILVVVDGYGSLSGNFNLVIDEYQPPLGACCVGNDCVATNLQSECLALGGTWHEGEDCATYTCPADPMYCPAGSFYQQNPTGSTAATSDMDISYIIYDDLTNASGEVHDIHFWGIMGTFTDDWYECADTGAGNPFEIKVYPDDGTGMPDAENPYFTWNGTLTGVDTGELFAGFIIWRWDLTLDAQDYFNVTPGSWISVQGGISEPDSCWFLWHNSFDANLFSYQVAYDDTSELWEEAAYDLSICLTGAGDASYGACCDDASGTCEDDVLIADCPPSSRFAADTPCSQLDPPCGIQGACCVDGDCVGTMNLNECMALEGWWFEGEDCANFECPPTDPCEGAIYTNGAPSGGGARGVQCDPYYPMSAGVADDFVLDDTASTVHITQVVAWFGHFNGNGTPADYDGITVTIYANQSDSTPNEPGGKPFHPPDSTHYCTHVDLMGGNGIVYETQIAAGGFGYIDESSLYGYDRWRLLLPVSVDLDVGVKYWLEVQPILDFASYGQSGWLPNDSTIGDAAMQIFELLGTNEWSALAEDCAFCLHQGPACLQFVPGDANMVNGQWPPLVIGGDVTYLVGYFRGLNPPCLVGGFYSSGDANGDCLVIGSDVTRMVAYFRGLQSLNYCPDNVPCWPTPGDVGSTPEPSGWPNCEPEPSGH
jgi:hypothetical protein